MDDELKKALVDSLSFLKDGLEKGSSFVLEQAPLVVQEYINYVRFITLAQVICGILTLVAMYFTLPRYLKYLDGPYERHNEAETVVVGVVGAIGHIAAGILSIVGICQIGTCIMAWVAPRVLILEKIAEMVK